MQLIPKIHGSAAVEPTRVPFPAVLRVECPELSPTCAEAFLVRTGAKEGPSDFVLRIEKDSVLPREGYRLRMQAGAIHVSAAEEAGAIWALTTAASLIDDGGFAPCDVADSPLHPFRGLHLDCARHFFPAEEVKRVIEAMSLLKLNVFHWHLSDDQGWRVESRRFPKLNEVGGPCYTQAEIRDVVAFADSRGVTVLPEIDMPGHVTAILCAYPELSCTGEPVTLAVAGGIYPVILCPGKEETFRFIQALLEEICPLFPGEYFHIGGDEAPKIRWKTCPHCQKRMEAEGITSLNDLQGYFTARVIEMLRRLGKKPVCWNDTLMAKNGPKDVLIQYWAPQHAGMEGYLQEGGAFICSDMFDLYLDYPPAMTPLKRVYHSAPSLGGVLLEDAPGFTGFECCLWTERVDSCALLEERLFPRVLAVAERAWAGGGDYAEFRARVQATAAGRLGQTVRFLPEDRWDPTGDARREEAMAYLALLFSGAGGGVTDGADESAGINEAFVQGFLTKFLAPEDAQWILPKFKALMGNAT